MTETNTAIIKLTEAVRLLAEIKTVQDAHEVIAVAEAARIYAQQFKLGTDAENHATEIKLRAMRLAGTILSQSEMNEGGRPTKPLPGEVGVSTPTLDDMGISYKQSSRWQQVASVPEPEFEQHIAETKAGGEELTTASVLRIANGKPESLHISDDSYEWFTPSEYIEAARAVMGSIDTDPASCIEANKVVQAGTFYTVAEDGLSLPWRGNVFCNPPYNMPWIQRFIDKAIAEYGAGNVGQAIVLTNNSTDTGWFHSLLSRCPVCLTRGRVRFWGADGDTLATRQGQAIFYLGPRAEAFTKEFSVFGAVVARVDGDN